MSKFFTVERISKSNTFYVFAFSEVFELTP
jgi:hypothetical protein